MPNFFGYGSQIALDLPGVRVPIGGIETMYGTLPPPKDYAADALIRISDALRDKQKTRFIDDEKRVAAALDSNAYTSAAAQVRTDVAVLESIRQGQISEYLISQIEKHPRLIGLLATYFLLTALCFSLLFWYPFSIWLINEKLKALPRIRLPSWLGQIELSIQHLLIVGFFHFHPRILDAWIDRFGDEALRQLSLSSTFSQRAVYVETPVEMDRMVLPALAPKDLRKVFSDQRFCVLLHGEGGSGKTSLACQIGLWAMSHDQESRPCTNRMLPVLIEQDLDLNVGKDKVALIEFVRGQIHDRSHEIDPPSPELVSQLLKRKRILLIVDGLSELSQATRQMIRPIDPQFAANASILTSRFEETLDGVKRTTIKPMRIEGNRLSSFMEAYFSRCGKRELFTDTEFFEGCRLLSTLVGEKDSTVLLARLFAEQMMAVKENRDGRSLPKNVPSLMLEYLNLLNYKHQEMDDRSVHIAAQIVAWECVRGRFRPSAARYERLIEVLGERAPFILEFLEKRLGLVQTIGSARNQVRFALDPLAEYLAALHVVTTFRENVGDWKEFVRLALLVSGAPQTIRGFLFAVYECSVGYDVEIRIPESVMEQLAEWTLLPGGALKSAASAEGVLVKNTRNAL
jgi:hypothetical protein